MYFYADNYFIEKFGGGSLIIMYLKMSLQPKYSMKVRDLQLKLNVIRINVHGDWPYLKADGLFGKQTEIAVKGFQSYRNITPISGEVGDTTMKYINESYSHVPMLSSAGTTSVTERTTLLQSVYNGFEFIADKILKQFAEILKTVSDSAAKELSKLNNLKLGKVSSEDIRRISRSLYENPHIKKMQKIIEQEVYEYLQKVARGNTNVGNYKHNAEVYKQLENIKSAQRQLSKGLNNQTVANINKKLAEQLCLKCMTELESVNFAKKLTQRLEYLPKMSKIGKVTGGGILTALTLLPFVLHLIELIYNGMTGKPTERIMKQVVADIISLVEGVLIGVVVGGIVAIVGLTGSVAVLAVVVIGLVIGIALMCFFPDHEKDLADKLINGLSRVIHSPVFQETAHTSYV